MLFDEDNDIDTKASAQETTGNDSIPESADDAIINTNGKIHIYRVTPSGLTLTVFHREKNILDFFVGAITA